MDLLARGVCQVELQIAVASGEGLEVDEQLTILHRDHQLVPVEVRTPHGGRLHLVDLPPGPTQVRYSAKLRGRATPPAPTSTELALYRRPSRYVHSDLLGGFAEAEFGGVPDVELAAAVAAWVGTRLRYVPGSTGPAIGATETLLAGAGVCRDYAHLVVALLRALGVPARFASVYAPGCSPMDFHAVAEAYIEGSWSVVDASALAPRSCLVRIATGRDATDTAFLSTTVGYVDLGWTAVSAVTDQGLPGDDLDERVSLG